MMDTPAWKSLDATARALYVDMATRYNGSNNGSIFYSIREGVASLRIGKATVSRALRDLEGRGFIVAVQRGAFSLKVRNATVWRLTEFSCDVRKQYATKNFAHWSPENLELGACSGTARYPRRNRTVPVGEPSVSKTARTVSGTEP
jgi:DNA-binding transcriptional MocR family regulator